MSIKSEESKQINARPIETSILRCTHLKISGQISQNSNEADPAKVFCLLVGPACVTTATPLQSYSTVIILVHSYSSAVILQRLRLCTQIPVSLSLTHAQRLVMLARRRFGVQKLPAYRFKNAFWNDDNDHDQDSNAPTVRSYIQGCLRWFVRNTPLSFAGAIPSALGGIPVLEQLIVHNNKLSGE